MTFPNITPDTATGIGLRGDAELARLFRRGIDHRGGIGLPFMMYADLSDRDLSAVLSYLRSLDPIGHAVPRSEYNLLGKITRAYFLEPFAPGRDVSADVEPGRTAEYGEYLVNAVANCAGCHTARNMKTGEYTGPRFGGGMVFRRADAREQAVVSPNLTPDPETGVMASWDEAAFIRRFRAGGLMEWSPMPWGPFSRIGEDDLAAMFRYLRTLPPIRRPAERE
jgi:mono/diheme cytochrome c family protein